MINNDRTQALDECQLQKNLKKKRRRGRSIAKTALNVVTIATKLMVMCHSNNKALDLPAREEQIRTKHATLSVFFLHGEIISSYFLALSQFVVIQEQTSILMIQLPVVVAPKSSLHGRRAQQFPVS